jgi:hypothetical protein
MTQFADAIGISLAIFDNNSIGDIEYYKNLGWSGDMLNTDVFDVLTHQKRQAIEEANRAEGNAEYNATNSRKGKKCKE